MKTFIAALRIKYPFLVNVFTWTFGLLLALALLAGRYKWTPEASNFSWRSYLMSAFMLVITLPTFYYLLKIFIKRTLWAQLIFFLVAIWFVLPYQWLRLDHWYYNLNRPPFWPSQDPTLPAPRLDWFPQALDDLGSIPYETPFFIVLIILGVASAIAYWQNQNKRYIGTQDGKQSNHTKSVLFFLGLYTLILFQTWMHLSMRSPAVYVSHFVAPVERASWYHGYLFPNAKGAVNLEYPAWRVLEENFMGVSQPMSERMLPRSFTFYVTSQWSYFFPPYFVYLARNILIWFAACLAAFQLARIWGYPKDVSVYFAALVGTGTGFISFASEAAGYLPAYAIIIILVYLFEVIVVAQSDGTEHKRVQKYVLFSCILGLSSLIYELFPMYLALLGFGVCRRISIPRLLMCFALALSIHFGFSLVQQHGPGKTLQPINQPVMDQAVGNLRLLLTHADFGQLYGVSVSFLRHYLGDLGNAFFVLPVLLAFGGLLLLRDPSKVLLILLLGVPSILTLAILHWGGPNLASDNPRFVYVAYPMIYLFAAVFIFRVKDFLMTKGQRVWARVAPWGLLVPIFFLNNVDVFGFPQTYFFFWENNFIFK